ncbi:MAG: NAD(P)/FAD-dependent oxidoreductase, partial [Bacteroidota bacterium]
MHTQVAVIGSGFGALTCAALLAQKGLRVTVLEQNYLPGGCTSSYWRKGFVFEAGATTVVGMDEHMPLKQVADATGINFPLRKLDLPMLVHLPQGGVLRRHQDLSQWIEEASLRFPGDQEGFWRRAYEVSQFVWSRSGRYKSFPPSRWADAKDLLTNFTMPDLKYAPLSFISTKAMMERYKVASPAFNAFVNEQLLITAQNKMEEVNFLFGAAALCYTNYSNYYVDGGLINLVNPLIQYIEGKGGQVLMRTEVSNITRAAERYVINTKKQGEFTSDFLVSGIPLNNTQSLFPSLNVREDKVMKSEQLNGAFQMGIGFKSEQSFESLHHQIHLVTPLPYTGSNSIFLSLNHAQDTSRSDLPGCRVASISTHVPDPGETVVDGATLEALVIDVLEQKGFLRKEDVIYQHSSTPKSWHKWTKRSWGFVGGYP